MPNVLALSLSDARRLIACYHFQPADVAGVFGRLGSAQYDPLNPVGRNHDLVLQARVPGYEVGDWEAFTYGVFGERTVYDAWDKQACLVPVSDWAYRRFYHATFAPRWSQRVLEPHAEAVEATLSELEQRGPLSSLEFTDQAHIRAWRGSWHGPKLVKNILRALWYTGQIVTHHRDKGRHVYSLSEAVIPQRYLEQEVAKEEGLRHIILRRHQSAGLLRPNADASLWMPIGSAERKPVVEALVQEGALIKLELEGQTYHALPSVLAWLERPLPEPRMIFLAPLDSLMWDRKAVKHLFDFDYVWEVYKPEHERRWGYYVLPVFYGERFVGRFDSRLEGDTWHLLRWWWEAGVEPGADMLGALEDAVKRFKKYLNADKVKLPRGLGRATRAAWQAGAKG